MLVETLGYVPLTLRSVNDAVTETVTELENVSDVDSDGENVFLAALLLEVDDGDVVTHIRAHPWWHQRHWLESARQPHGVVSLAQFTIEGVHPEAQVFGAFPAAPLYRQFMVPPKAGEGVAHHPQPAYDADTVQASETVDEAQSDWKQVELVEVAAQWLPHQ